MLIAVWDGQAPKPGGTGALARQACDSGIPAVWITTAEECPPRLITGFDGAGAPQTADADCTLGPLENALWPVFAAPPAGADARTSSRGGLDRYLSEVLALQHLVDGIRFSQAAGDPALASLVRLAKPPEKRTGEWKSFLDASPQVKSLRGRLEEILLPRFIWADELAVHFSHRYRSVYVLAYLLSAFAVIIALAGIFGEHPRDPMGNKVVFVVFELLVIGFILGIVIVGRWWLWHERWLQYRTLAENLRHVRFLAFVSEFGRIRVPSADPEDHEPSWVLWYIRATFREIGLPTAELDGTYQWRLLNATLIPRFQSQLAWHRTNRDTSRRMDHILHYVGIGCFLFTFIVLIIFLGHVWRRTGMARLGASRRQRQGSPNSARCCCCSSRP